MPALFDNKVIFVTQDQAANVMVKVYAQPSVTSIYLDGELQIQNENEFEYTLSPNLKGKKIRIHTSVQDKNENTDDIKVTHTVVYGDKQVERKVDTSASEEGDIFDIFTDIRAF